MTVWLAISDVGEEVYVWHLVGDTEDVGAQIPDTDAEENEELHVVPGILRLDAQRLHRENLGLHAFENLTSDL